MIDSTITIEAMAARIAAGDALPLLPDGVPGPVQYDGRWWAVPLQETSYQPITEPATVQQLNEHAQRLHRARRAARAARGGSGETARS